MNGFRKLQQRLNQEGWFVEWNMPCCQSCAWAEVPDDADLDKVLFNHSQDCECDLDADIHCKECDGDGFIDEETMQDCPECKGSGKNLANIPIDADTSVDGFICNTPENQDGSMFCFSGDKKGVENLKAILPIIEECGCDYSWNESGEERIFISW